MRWFDCAFRQGVYELVQFVAVWHSSFYPSGAGFAFRDINHSLLKWISDYIANVFARTENCDNARVDERIIFVAWVAMFSVWSVTGRNLKQTAQSRAERTSLMCVWVVCLGWWLLFAGGVGF
jgi:hypothetical protein